MMTLGLFALVSTALYYLGSRAMITKWLWSRYSPGFARFMDCPACTGFWFGVVLSLVLGDLFPPVFMNHVGIWHGWVITVEAILVGLCMLVLTPLGAALMQHALIVNGTVLEDQESP